MFSIYWSYVHACTHPDLPNKLSNFNKNNRCSVNQLYLIGTTPLVSDHPIHLQAYTDLKLIGKCNSYYTISIWILVVSCATVYETCKWMARHMIFPLWICLKLFFFYSKKGCLFFRSQCTQYPGIPSLAVSFLEVKLSSTVLHNSGCYFKCIPFRQCKLLHSRRTTYLVPVCWKDPSQAPRDTGTFVKSHVP